LTISSYSLDKQHKGFVHVVQTGGTLQLNDATLQPGDGAFIEEGGDEKLTFTGMSDTPVEFVFFDITH
jgi:hypothetical protein